MKAQILLMLGAGLVLFGLTIVVLMQRLQLEERIIARIRHVQREVGIDDIGSGEGGHRFSWRGQVATIGELLMRTGMLSAKTIEELHQNLRIAGFRDRDALGVLIGGKLLLLIGTPFGVWALLRWSGLHMPMSQLWPFGGGIIGLLAPDYVLGFLRRRYIRALERGLPDALDLLVICSEAGLALEAALERVGVEVRQVHPAVADEMLHTTQELRVNSDRRVALTNMGTRTGVENLRRLAGTLAQTLQYGTPLSQALRVLSTEMRAESLTAFETRAGRLPVLMTLPMILFILPCVFMVVGGPAMVQVIQTLRH